METEFKLLREELNRQNKISTGRKSKKMLSAVVSLSTSYCMLYKLDTWTLSGITHYVKSNDVQQSRVAMTSLTHYRSFQRQTFPANLLTGAKRTCKYTFVWFCTVTSSS